MQRTLAPRVYEGGAPVRTLGRGECNYHSCFSSLFYFMINYSAYTVKVLINIRIAKPYYFQSVLFQYSCSGCILFLIFRVIMAAAIQFNYQFCTKTIKICNIMINTFLPLKTYGIIFQKTIP